MCEEFEYELCSFGEDLGKTFSTAKRLSRIAQGREAHSGLERMINPTQPRRGCPNVMSTFWRTPSEFPETSGFFCFPGCALRPWAILDNRFAVENRPTHLTQYPLGWLREYDFFPYHQYIENDSVSLFVFLGLTTQSTFCGQPKIDKVQLVEADGFDLLYVVITQPLADNTKRCEVVVRHAEEALQTAARYKFKGTTKGNERPKHDGNVVFFIRHSRKVDYGAVTGFGIAQLQEISAAEAEKGKNLVRRHAWSLGKLP